ncbi:MAG: hypothetical protein H0T46_01765 [Deltaproteobacteria bacterium]|nr:hypothetical protein [Deltaproteobacteria bacterium]
MTPLAHEIYRQLLRHLRRGNPSITYAELAAAVSKKYPTHPRSSALYAALGEVTSACRAKSLPCLPAIVWSSTAAQPGVGYFKVAHPRAKTEKSQVEAWEREHADVVREAMKFPPTL